MKRTHYAGALREQHAGMRVTVTGWVQTKRDMGGVVFIDLRDREGTLQTVFDAAHLPQADFSTAEGLKNESVVAVSGLVRIRSEETYNPLLETGTIELKAERLELLSEAAPLPFPIEGAAIYYVGPTPERPGCAIGAAGPTTSGRMDAYTPRLLDLGLACMIGKGKRDEAVKAAVVRNGAVYLSLIHI